MKKYILRFRSADKDIFKQIRKGKKTVETRAGSSMYASIKTGDILVFICEKGRLEKKVKKVKRFRSIESLFEEYKIGDVMPNVKNRKEAEDIYYSFPGYRDRIKKYGLLAFEI